MNIENNASRHAVRRERVAERPGIHLSGPFDAMADLIFEYAAEILAEGNRELTIDLGAVSYMTSQGIACIIKLLKQVQAANASMYVSGASTDMIDLIRLARIEKYITII